MTTWTGVAMLGFALLLIVVGRPNAAGEHRRFLRFQAAPVLYPPLILAFIALGAAALISGLTGQQV